MNKERYIAALEISSSKIIGAVGIYSGNGQLSVIAVEQEECKDYVRYGIIQNLEGVSMHVNSILSKLSRNPAIAPRKITSVFIGLSGRSMRSISSEVKLSFSEETEITDSILERLRKDATMTAIDNSLEVVDVVPRNYIIDKIETNSPKGSIGRSITAIYDIIACRPELKRNIIRAITDRIHVNVAVFVVTPLATGHLIVTREEKRLGCMLVDFGAETTTVSIYRKGCLYYSATLPLGGRNITRDITSLSVLEERAEEIKCTSGDAIARETPSTLNINGLKLSDVSNLIVARAEEIAANVIQQLEYAGLKKKDVAGGIICIGGASKLNGMLELLEKQSGLSARLGHMPEYVHPADARTNRLEALQVVSLLYAGATVSDTECLEMPGIEELPRTGEGNEEEPAQNQNKSISEIGKRKSKFFNGARNFFGNLFAPPQEDDSSELE